MNVILTIDNLMRVDDSLNVDNSVKVYNSLLSCDESFFSSLSEAESKICLKIADYFFEGSHGEKINDEDLKTIQARIDQCKQKTWTLGETPLKKEALEEIYKRFHPERITIAHLPREILCNYIFPLAGQMQINRACKRWAFISQDNQVWESIARKIGCPTLSATPGTMHTEVKKYCRGYARKVSQLPNLPPNIKELLTGEMTTEKMVQLKEWDRANSKAVVEEGEFTNGVLMRGRITYQFVERIEEGYFINGIFQGRNLLPNDRR